MGMGRSLTLLAAGSLSIASAAPVVAAPVASASPAVSRAEIVLSGGIRKLEDLNFAVISTTSSGTAVIDPNTDTLTTTGGVAPVGGAAYAALFQVEPSRRGAVDIYVPSVPVTITRQSGTETMTVSNWTLSSNATLLGNGRYRIVATLEPFEFKVGGTLNVNANQADGFYVGTFTIDVQYP